ncbi:MAG: PilX protein [Xanthomonadales bacterium]|nr:PilX protein [Xanthomonadales bacterium]
MSLVQITQRRQQQGAALVVVLLLLLVMTWMGVSSMRGTMMGERMSAAAYDRSIGFQAAESALREGEGRVQPKPAPGFIPVAGCVSGVCAQRLDLLVGELQRWEDPAITWIESNDSLSAVNDGASSAISTSPEYLIESMGLGSNWPGCEREMPINPKCLSPRYRVTSRSSEADRARVTLQSSVSTF